MSSVRVPHATFELFSSTAILRVFWLKTTNIFNNIYSIDGKWIVTGDVHAIALKKINLRLSYAAPPSGFVSILLFF